MPDSPRPSESAQPSAGQPRKNAAARPPSSTQPPQAGDTSQVGDITPADSGPFRTFPYQFGRYRIERLLGSGQMGTVYLAEDVQLDRQIALKVPKTSDAPSETLLRRMQTEAKSLAKIDHPHVCRVYDFGSYEGIQFLAMEYIPGEELSDILKRVGKKRKPKEAVKIITQIATALGAAHERGVIHRDLKPGNVRRRSDGKLVVVDFGLARQTEIDPAADRTQGGTILGSAAYMSPEQANGRVDDIDARSDVYALGVMLFELLTGEWPFQGKIMEILGRKSILDPPDPRTLEPDIPPRLAEICLKMLAREQQDRYAFCSEIIRDLQAVDFKAQAVETAELEATENSQSEISTVEAEKSILEAIKESSGETLLQTGPFLKRNKRRKKPSLGTQLKDFWTRQPAGYKLTMLGALPITCLLAVILFFPTQQGVLKIEIDDPTLAVNFDGQSITVNQNGQPIKVRPTRAYTLSVEQNGTLIEGSSREVTLRRGQERLVKVSLLDGQLAIDGQLVSRLPAAASVAAGNSAPGNLPIDDDSGRNMLPFPNGSRAGEMRELTNLGIKFHWCPAGTFQMGSPASETGRSENEDDTAGAGGKPVQVTLTRGFWMSQAEVTQAQWEHVMGTKPWLGKHHYQVGPRFPATFILKEMALEYCQKLTTRERFADRISSSQKYSLPTEAQWEYACRAGTTTRYSFGDDASKIGAYSWFRSNAYDTPQRYAHQVGLKLPNPWGLHDMYGNVSEWCLDDYSNHLTGGADPQGPYTGIHLLRGGMYFTPAAHCRSASRHPYTYNDGRYYDGIGFRIVLIDLPLKDDRISLRISSGSAITSSQPAKFSDSNKRYAL